MIVHGGWTIGRRSYKSNVFINKDLTVAEESATGCVDCR